MSRTAGFAAVIPTLLIALFLTVAAPVAIAPIATYLADSIGLATPSGHAALAQSFPQPRGYVNDFADVLSQSEEQKLEGMLLEADRRYQVQLAIVTMKDIDGYEPADYATRLFETWGIGNQETDQGLLILDARKERQLRIEVGYGLEGVLNDAKVGRIYRNVMVPHLKRGNANDAYVAGALALLEPVVVEAGGTAADVDALASGRGMRVPVRRGARSSDPPLWVIVLILVIVMIVLSKANKGGRGRRYRRGGTYWGSGGGFGGFGGGGGGGGGFGGFGGGLSGGGGGGGGY